MLHNMNIRNIILTGLISSACSWCTNWAPKKEADPNLFNISHELFENVDSQTDIDVATFDIRWDNKTTWWLSKSVENQISICLSRDGNSFTYSNDLESIENPQEQILEMPISHLFQKFWERNHPLAVRWVSKTFGSLLWKNGIEKQFLSIPQKLKKREEKILSSTWYEIWDTLRFKLINPELQWAFPQLLWEQLQMEWFKSFTNSDDPDLEAKKDDIFKIDFNNSENVHNFIYDIVVKRLPDWRSALAVYRDGKLFMASYVSVWVKNRKTITWQFEILWKYPYYKSRKYKSPMPNWLKFSDRWYFFHQGNVSWYPASHWCVRLPWVYALSLYSLVKNSEHVDVFIDTNLYQSPQS